MTEETKETWFDFFECQTPDVNGVSMEDFGKSFAMFIPKFVEKMWEEEEEWGSEWAGYNSLLSMGQYYMLADS